LLRDPSYRQELWRAWKPKLTREVRVGIPAILGLTDSLDILTEAEEIIGVDLFEIPSLPPSLPGLRLELTLKNRLIQTGGEITEGPVARGRIDGRSKGRRTAGVQLDASGGIRSIDAKSLLLATGGFLHGGLKALQNGSVVESVFGIPVYVSFLKEQWSHPKPWEPQAYAQIGLRTDQHLRPQDQKGKAFLQNVFAAGGVLGGADRTYEGSRQGIDLVTAYHAIQSITALC